MAKKLSVMDDKVLYHLLFDNMVDGLAYCKMFFDAEGRPVDFVYLKINKNFEKLTGLKKATGKKATEIISGIKLSNPELFEIYGRVSLTGKSERFEIYIKPLMRWFSISVFSPRRKFFAAVFQNITDRKEVEKNLMNAKIAAQNVLEDLSIEKAKLEMAQAKEEAILLSIGDGLVATDEHGYVILFNKTAEKLLGIKNKDAMGTIFSQILRIENEKGVVMEVDKHPVSMALSRNVSTHIPIVSDSYYMSKNVGRFPVAIMATPVVLDGKVIGTIEVFRDITREKEIDRAKSEFVSLASHQLRTPLTAISWYTEMILRGDVGTVVPTQRKYLEEIYKGNQRMIDLVNTLLDVSRIELGTFNSDPKPIDIFALASSVLNEQKQRIKQKKLTLIPTFASNISTFLTDPKLLRIVFQNLLSNAIEYTPSGGTVGFTISSDTKDTIDVQVSDTGYGIPKDQQNKIFTKFFRADNVRNKDTGGTGLGLYIVKSIVENFGGKIWFESEENKGTLFHAHLPATVLEKKLVAV
ncbi:MAG: hypothetical protein A3C79_03235 [Candidatus Taylorbacteria bacterium RIFCSPHIGHO2_02_FULL_45_28]|uniref:histidine kinase n=1 Tax=Candidatus Taylorbacteria bacterium RIFCSPHIGHO2_12_FULL_45_16 TaxID=1802315 RepID=A0A1G2N116_9BACT|nr:MAG: hypothetical protein A2830_00955 [Candidatus Taylorbacteria bacterium RIFCSPHIGHO2_01_FULL_44_110]OHA24970.1 MAG: hypothetical protein A3C79_03235 [Candidatus Taylorbacteria bacterium RIFCSPHIGHO2_02_FULL_45_28]OHA29788.1 MAG: hypothetical protein A3F51_03650 [Candidatus Taylorbacteria bacterium RIFCSPHIGHO2_12_FULL_45_16]OHA32732.1 MAG: hypothetical protein A3A23_00520 [Candidatus Taylorbacteria bacterium RIFCSPLOWO2_01_FULL_45_59]OHA39026.1 MAG: hypothetical protein A3I98_00095 [Candi